MDEDLGRITAMTRRFLPLDRCECTFDFSSAVFFNCVRVLVLGLKDHDRESNRDWGTEMAEQSESKSPKIQVEGAIPKLHLSMPLDASKIEAIRKCLEKGNLSITISEVDLASGRIGDSWLYD
jgi:hypothetical protein